MLYVNIEICKLIFCGAHCRTVIILNVEKNEE